MATAKKTKEGTWRVLAYVGKKPDGSRQYKSFTASTKKAAELMAAQYKAENETSLEKITVRQAMEQYIDSKEHVLSPSTIYNYRKILNRRLSLLMNYPVDSLTTKLIQRAISIESQNSSPKTVRNVYALLKSSLNQAGVYDIFQRITLPQKQPAEIKIPTDEEIQKMLEYFKNDFDMTLAILMASQLGLRRSEICALTWDDVQGDYISISKAMVIDKNRNWIIKAPKSVSGNRILPMTLAVKQFLKTAENQTGRILSIHPDIITQRFWHMHTPYHFHALRHYNASVMLALGVPNKYAMERMGHATDNMLKQVYQHTTKAKRDEISSQINDFFNYATGNATGK